MRKPQHLAIIMDGNGRWAELRHKPRHYGHIKGTKVAKSIIQECVQVGIKNLTLYAFSTENWLRPKSEVSILMKLLKKYLQKEVQSLVEENIQFNVIGNIDRLPADVRSTIEEAKSKTHSCAGMKLTFALSYGSRQEITNAMRQLAKKVKAGDLDPNDITEDLISTNLQTSYLPDPDLILRTSGEYRLSNFLMWQSAYSEFYFSDKLWPDFQKADLIHVLGNFAQRERRFGRIETAQKHEQLSN